MAAFHVGQDFILAFTYAGRDISIPADLQDVRFPCHLFSAVLNLAGTISHRMFPVNKNMIKKIMN